MVLENTCSTKINGQATRTRVCCIAEFDDSDHSSSDDMDMYASDDMFDEVPKKTVKSKTTKKGKPKSGKGKHGPKRKETDEKSPNMEELMHVMDRELAKTDVGKSFEKSKSKVRIIGYSDSIHLCQGH